MRNAPGNQQEESWQRLIFYGEAFGFVAAWVVGLVMLVHSAKSDNKRSQSPRIDSFAGVNHDNNGPTLLK